MSRKSSFITVIGAVLVLALPATGLAKGRIVEAPQWQQALEARSEGLNKQYGLGQYASQVPQWKQALEARSEGLNKQYGLGQFASQTNVQPPMDVFERAVASANTGGRSQTNVQPPMDVFERAVASANTGGRGLVFDNYRASAPVGEGRQLVFDNYRNAQPTSSSTPISAGGSGREIDWPQVGVGLGIGIVLMIGLYLAVKGTRQRPLAH